MKTIDRKTKLQEIDSVSVKESFLKDIDCVNFLKDTLINISKEKITDEEMKYCLQFVEKHSNCSFKVSDNIRIWFLKNEDNIDITVYQVTYQYFIA